MPKSRYKLPECSITASSGSEDLYFRRTLKAQRTCLTLLTCLHKDTPSNSSELGRMRINPLELIGRFTVSLEPML